MGVGSGGWRGLAGVGRHVDDGAQEEPVWQRQGEGIPGTVPSDTEDVELQARGLSGSDMSTCVGGSGC